jgi:hypothetical protein
MTNVTQTHYQALGVERTARSPDIVRSYKRLRSQLTSDAAAPDPKRLKRVEEAFAVLNDAARREAYDVSLVEAKRSRTRKKTLVWLTTIVVGVVAIVWGYVELRPPPPKSVAGGASQEEILNAASVAVGRLQAMDLTGRATDVGVAFAVAENVMVAPCRGIGPAAQLTVSIPPRTIPARVASVDEKLGLCKLAAHGTGTRPLPVAGVDPKSGDRLIAANVGGTGKVALAEGYVRKVDSDERLIDASFRETAVTTGSPLIDAYGRVVGLAFVAAADGKTRHVGLPRAWIREINEPPPPEQKTQASGDDVPEKAPEKSLEPSAPGIKLSPEHQKRLEKQFRPPPKLPDDL